MKLESTTDLFYSDLLLGGHEGQREGKYSMSVTLNALLGTICTNLCGEKCEDHFEAAQKIEVNSIDPKIWHVSFYGSLLRSKANYSRQKLLKAKSYSNLTVIAGTR